MMDYRIRLRFITPMFGHGATDAPEIRPSSIRGQLHNWFRLLGGTIAQERAVFGGIRQKGRFSGHDTTMASKIVVRVANVVGSTGDEPTLPHKAGGYAALRSAYRSGTTCEIRVFDRLGGIADPEAAALFERALRAWLLMGTLGFRSTRAAGSFAWECPLFEMPEDAESYVRACTEVIGAAPVRFGVLEKEYSKEKIEKARRLVSDSLGGHGVSEGKDDLMHLHQPLGCIKPTRKTSPLKYRIVACGESYRILAVWDGREEVTGNTSSDLDSVIDLLVEKKPDLGFLLRAAFG